MREIAETLHPHFRMTLDVDRLLVDFESSYQRIQVIENRTFGRALYLDGVLQTTEADEFIYHEMLVHVPILAHGDVRRVLIIGGGDGGSLEEALKHSQIESATLVEIDGAVIEVAREHLGAIHRGAFDDSRAVIEIGDGAEFVETCGEGLFDMIIVDSPDPIGPGEVLFGERFYRACRRALREDGGLLACQLGVPFVQPEELPAAVQSLRAIFNEVGSYMATVPTYVGGPMAFGLASENFQGIVPTFRDSGITTRYYTPEVHEAAFTLPRYVQELIG